MFSTGENWFVEIKQFAKSHSYWEGELGLVLSL